ncbi:ribonuclease P protein component [Simiduia agarivorans]|uniref:Ribonuclease P protein component n=2 Tax=Simiduia TaxID=447467 RepID=K4KNI6_SIMAS|nr:ribonuclease P protein component [Simiduia agarivorans]AFU99648.1 ribonuclease P [Simiduia agarivorans SA1 = DSM 21679]
MSAQTYGKTLRLLSPGDFKQVFDKATFRAPHQHFMLLACSNGLEHPRLGLVISKKNVRHAVNRNRIKRQVREYFRLHQQELPAIDCIFLARRGLDQVDSPTLVKQLQAQFKRLSKKALRDNP